MNGKNSERPLHRLKLVTTPEMRVPDSPIYVNLVELFSALY